MRSFPRARGGGYLPYFLRRQHQCRARERISPRRIFFKTVSVEEFCEIARIGRTRAYELFETGAVKSVLVGRLRLVLLQSWYDHLARLCEEQAVFTPGRRPGRAQAAGKPALTKTEPPPPRRRGRPPKYARSDTAVNPAQAVAAMAASNSNN